MWKILRNFQIKGLKFRRQYPIENYIVDFVCKDIKLVIEIDGGQHNETNNIEYDKARTEFLKSKGYKVIRFWNCDIDNNIEGVYQEILKVIKGCTLAPTLSLGEGVSTIILLFVLIYFVRILS